MTAREMPERLNAGTAHEVASVHGKHYTAHITELTADGLAPVPVGGLVVPIKVMARNRADCATLSAELVRRWNAHGELLAFVERVASEGCDCDAYAGIHAEECFSAVASALLSKLGEARE